MKLVVSKDRLNNSLQKVNSIIGTRSTLQILGNILLEAKDGKLTLSSTDLDIRIKTEMSADVIVPGNTTIPAKKFHEITRELLGEEITLEAMENNHVAISSEKTNFKLLGLAADDFPLPLEIHPNKRYTLEQDELARMLNLISYAVNQDDTRKALNGILLSLNDENFVSVATDGRRLALVERSAEGLDEEGIEAILPVKSAVELNRLLGKEGGVTIEIGDNMATFSLDDNSTVMTSKLIDENYPNYKQVIPVSFSRIIELPREIFTAALRRVSLVVSARNFFVKIKFANNKVEFSANSTDVGESVDSIDIEYEGPETIVSFNPIFLLEPLNRLDCDTISMQMNDGYSPIALSSGDGFLYVIMPMRNRQ